MIRSIDYWVNPFTPEQRQRNFFECDEMADLIRWWHMEDRVPGLTPRDFVAMMDRTGMSVAITMSFKMASLRKHTLLWDTPIEETHRSVKDHQDRLKALYGINPWKRMEGVREMERAVKELGFIGAHLHTYGFGIPLNHREYWPYYAKCMELDVPVVMQVGHSAEFLPSELARPIYVDDIALYFPELRIVASHTGWPWVEEAIAMAWKHPNVYLGTAGHHPKYLDPSLVRFMNSRGIGKVMFGSTHPVILYDDALAAIDKLPLKDEAREAYKWKTAAKVFRL